MNNEKLIINSENLMNTGLEAIQNLHKTHLQLLEAEVMLVHSLIFLKLNLEARAITAVCFSPSKLKSGYL